jgi:hypothetical protein
MQSGDFRPAALYTHPLAGAMATSFAIFLVLALDLSFLTTGILVGIFALGLLSFGGRAALAITFALLLLRGGLEFVTGIFRRKFSMRLFVAMCLGLFVLLPMAAFIVTNTTIGDRIVNNWYFDDSAEVRVIQWQILDHLSLSQALFGVPGTEVMQIYVRVGLTGVENPILILLLNLGLIGLPVFLTGLVCFALYIYRAYPQSRWLLLAAILILSGSNSIGVKAPDLFMLIACAAATRPRRLDNAVSPQVAVPEQPRPRQSVGSRLTTILRPAHGFTAAASSRETGMASQTKRLGTQRMLPNPARTNGRF